jgi:hypothetical protein
MKRSSTLAICILQFAICNLQSRPAAAALTDNLAGYWKLDEASGNAVDSLGANNLTDTGSCGTTTGTINGARTFNGSTQYFTKSLLSGSQTAMSLGGWFNRSSSAHLILAGYGVTATARFNLNAFSDGNIYCQVENGTSVGGSCAFSGTGWHHIVMVYDGGQSTNATKLKVYIDGTAQTLSFSGTIPTGCTVTGNFELGREAAFTRFATGSADEVGLWTRALSQGEVTSLYNGGSGISYPFSSIFSSRGRAIGLGIVKGSGTRGVYQ